MTFVAHNPIDARHDIPGHPENARRTAAILDAFGKDPRLRGLPRITPDRPIAREDALRVHTPRVWLNLENHAGESQAFLDPDTYMVRGSFEAAVTTARLAQQAARRAMAGDEGGFVVARPPGHHATSDRSMGFCLLNNVAIAAEEALRAGAKRVLVFDHDVHHGNGTQEIFWSRRDVLYQSFHLVPHYPGTGGVDEIGEGDGRGYTVNAPLKHGDGDAEVRAVLRNVFLPIAKEFRPDLILFSSGFDSLAGDPLGGLTLSATSYGEMASAFRAVCPRIVAFLEGGYQLDRIGEAAANLLRALDGARVDASTTMRDPLSLPPLRMRLRDTWTSLR